MSQLTMNPVTVTTASAIACIAVVSFMMPEALSIEKSAAMTPVAPPLRINATVRDLPASGSGSAAELVNAGGATGDVSRDDLLADLFTSEQAASLTVPHVFELDARGAGVYEHVDRAFFPIDGRLIGNEGLVHNYGFAATTIVDFDFAHGTGQFIEIEGPDAAWIFVDDELVLEFAHGRPGVSHGVSFDRVGLVDRRGYELTVVLVERNPSTSLLRLRTNLTPAR